MFVSGQTLLLAFYFEPQITSGVQRAMRFYKYLPSYGHDVQVVCSSVDGTSNLSRVNYVPSPAIKVPITHELMAAYAHRLGPYNEQFKWVPHALKASSDLIQCSDISSIISTSPPVAAHVTALLLKRRFPSLKWIADFRDPIVGNPNRSRRWANGYDRILESAIFASADAILTVTDTIAGEWRHRYPKRAHKIHVLWNGFDPENVQGPIPPPPRSQRLLSHVGNLYNARYPNSITDSLKRLVQSRKVPAASIKLRQIGWIEDEQGFRTRPSVRYLSDCGCLDVSAQGVPRSEALYQTATSDYLLLLDIANGNKVAYAVPAKLYDYVPTGRPILAVTPRNGPVERILKKSGVQSEIIYLDDEGSEVDQKLERFLAAPVSSTVPSPWFCETFDGQKQLVMVSELLRP